MLLMGLQCHSDLLCEFVLQEFYRKLGVVFFKFVSYVFAIKIYHLSIIFYKIALQIMIFYKNRLQIIISYKNRLQIIISYKIGLQIIIVL